MIKLGIVVVVLGSGVLSATGASTATAANTTVCNLYCDVRDPAVAAGDRVPVTATVWSRTFRLHVSDGDDMAWASIDNGNPGDEAWLDRSWDGGATWSSGSKLGDTTIPSGYRGWRTMMYNVDDPAHRGVGAMRACGKAGDRPEIACTPWARSTTNADNPAAAGATALVQFWNPSSGSWPGWWIGANALTALIDYLSRSGRSGYSYVIGTTFDDNRNAQNGNFTNSYLDDTGWWGLAWLRAYDYTHDSRYLAMARTDDDYMNGYWDGTCGGGVWWSTARSYKNAVTNELFLKLSAGLHNRIAGDTTYLNRARTEWNWFTASGMINSSSLVNDGLTSGCANNNGTTWTYNQGVILGGLVELSTATGDATLLTRAQSIADAATAHLAVNGVLTEPCEANGCGNDGPAFKGIFMRNLSELVRYTHTTRYSGFISAQAASIAAHDTTPDGQSGLHWAGPIDAVDYARQQSAQDALNATL